MNNKNQVDSPQLPVKSNLVSVLKYILFSTSEKIRIIKKLNVTFLENFL